MANKVKELIYDVGARIGNPLLSDPTNTAMILRTMNFIYRELNETLLCVDKLLTIPAGTFSTVVNTYDLPEDWIEPFNIEPTDTTSIYTLIFVPAQHWNDNLHLNTDTFTILNKQLKFGRVSDASSFDILYRSYGSELVWAEDEDLATGQANTPEWNMAYWRLLIMLTAMAVSADYPLREQDIPETIEMKSRLFKSNKDRQGVTPKIIGGFGYGSPTNSRDPAYYNGMPVQRRRL